MWAPCAKESAHVEDLETQNLATEEAARRYYSAKEFVFKGKKVFSSKEPRPDNNFFDQSCNWYMLNDVPLQLQIEAFGDFPIATRLDKGEPRLL